MNISWKMVDNLSMMLVIECRLLWRSVLVLMDMFNVSG